MTAHKHAALMLQYAQDAAETDKPWERWNFQEGQNEWKAMSSNPSWYPDTDYRRKPSTIRIGEFDVPEPLREAPKYDTPIYIVTFDNPERIVFRDVWCNTIGDHKRLVLGMVHRTQEAAELHAEALLSFTKKT